ncbi:MAG: TIGR03013 family PEP-CTERM/XrtA system glycosyltransferase [Desulfobacterales bacterium]|nr:TIGR03013 family PEP-CTERM/XrtA system glycosyltransferase [Desulfobacterales bacterium]
MRRDIGIRHLILLIVEDAIILMAILIAMGLRFGQDVRFILMDSGEWLRIAAVVLTTQLSFYYHDLYELKVLNSRRELFIQLLQALGVTSIALSLLYYLFPDLVLGKGIFALFVLVVIGVVVVWRLVYSAILSMKRLSLNILLVGSGDMAAAIYAETLSRKTLGYHVIGCLTDTPPTDDSQKKKLPRVLGGFKELPTYAARPDIDRVVVAIGERRGNFPVRDLLALRTSGLPIEDGCSFYEELTGKLLVEYMRPSQIIFSEGFSKRLITLSLKRFMDFFASGVLLIISIPLWFFIPIAIKLDSRGPVFFTQERSGERGKAFRILKFRSMHKDAEERTGPIWAGEKDPRITRVGRFIRKTRIDEIPQLINIFKGQMSFVGPRPERPFFIEDLSENIPYYMLRNTVKPGLTGLAQVHYSYASSVGDAMEKLRYDLYYIKRLGFWMDLSIIFETIKVVLFGKGAK